MMTTTTQNHPKALTSRKRKTENPEGDGDGIGVLPDEILIEIVSGLTLKEAGRTSVLSRRWRDLWKFTSGSLDFDGEDTKSGNLMGATRLVTWVNRILKLHQGSSVGKLSICFGSPMDSSSPNPIGRWIRFVIQKQVRAFELKSIGGKRFPDVEEFFSIFRAAIVKRPRDNQSSQHCYSLKLKSLRLVDVNVKDKMIEYLLSICPCLEHLSLVRSKYTKDLRVVGQSLKSLVVGYCSNLKILEISLPNLVTFEYEEPCCWPGANPVTFVNVPLLSELKISGRCCASFVRGRQEHSGYCGQLKKLVLVANEMVVDSRRLPISHSPIPLPRLECLEQLELVFQAAAGESFLFFVLLTKACPCLSTMEVKFEYTYNREEEMDYFTYLQEKYILPQANIHHGCLKVVKLIGFCAYRGDTVFALSLLRIAKSLEKLIIEPYGHYYERVTEVRECARVLEAELPPEAELVLL